MALLTSAAVGAVSAYWIGRQTTPGDSATLAILCIVALGVGLAPISVEWMRRSFDPFNLKNIFVFYTLLQFPLYTLYSLITDSEWSTFHVTTDLYFAEERRAMELVIAGLACFHLGYYTYLRRRGEAKDYRNHHFSTLRPGRAFAIIAALWIVGIACTALLFRALGGVTAYINEREVWRVTGLPGLGYFSWGATSLFTLSSVLGYVVLFTPRSRLKGRYVECVAIALLGIPFIPSLLVGYRSLLVFPAMQLVLASHYLRKPLSLSRALGAVLASGIGIACYGRYRVTGELVPQDWESMWAFLGEVPRYLIVRSQGTDVVAVMLAQLDATKEFVWGVRPFVELVSLPLPRAIFPEKITSVGILFGERFFSDLITWNDDKGGVSPTVIGEFYWNFGWPGVVAGMFVVGLAARRAYSYLLAHQDAAGVILYGVVYVGFFYFAEAPTLAVSRTIIQAVVSVVILAVIAPHDLWRSSATPRAKTLLVAGLKASGCSSVATATMTDEASMGE